MSAMHFERVQRFILARKKKNGGLGHFKLFKLHKPRREDAFEL